MTASDFDDTIVILKATFAIIAAVVWLIMVFAKCYDFDEDESDRAKIERRYGKLKVIYFITPLLDVTIDLLVATWRRSLPFNGNDEIEVRNLVSKTKRVYDSSTHTMVETPMLEVTFGYCDPKHPKRNTPEMLVIYGDEAKAMRKVQDMPFYMTYTDLKLLSLNSFSSHLMNSYDLKIAEIAKDQN